MIDTKDARFAGGVILLVSIEPGLLAGAPARIAAVELCDPDKSSATHALDPNRPQIMAVMDKDWKIVNLDHGALDPLMAQHFLLEAIKNLNSTMLATCKLLGIQSREYIQGLQAALGGSHSRN